MKNIFLFIFAAVLSSSQVFAAGHDPKEIAALMKDSKVTRCHIGQIRNF